MTTKEKLKLLGYGIMSKLAFGVTFWANVPNYLLKSVDVFMNKVVRKIFDLPDDYPNRLLRRKYIELGWMQTRELRSYHDILTLESIMHSKHPLSFAEQLQTEFDRITRTAQQGNIRMTQETAPLYGPRREAFFSRACRLYNQLPAYNLPPMQTSYVLRIRGEPDEYRKELRSRLYWKMLNQQL